MLTSGSIGRRWRLGRTLPGQFSLFVWEEMDTQPQELVSIGWFQPVAVDTFFELGFVWEVLLKLRMAKRVSSRAGSPSQVWTP